MSSLSISKRSLILWGCYCWFVSGCLFYALAPEYLSPVKPGQASPHRDDSKPSLLRPAHAKGTAVTGRWVYFDEHLSWLSFDFSDLYFVGLFLTCEVVTVTCALYRPWPKCIATNRPNHTCQAISRNQPSLRSTISGAFCCSSAALCAMSSCCRDCINTSTPTRHSWKSLNAQVRSILIR